MVVSLCVGIFTINKEHDMLIKYYGKLCRIVRDVNEIAPHCVTRKIIHHMIL